MPDPEKEPTFNMLWRDLDRALSMPIFNKHETSLMQVARELSYTSSVVEGSKRAHPFRIHIARLAERRGLTRENLSRAVADLLNDRVFLGSRDRLRINKHFRQWTGRHALTMIQIHECEDAYIRPVTDCGESLPLATPTPSEHQSDNNPDCDFLITEGVTKKSQCDEIVTLCDAEDVTKKSHQCDEIVTESIPPYVPPSRKTEQSLPPASPPAPPVPLANGSFPNLRTAEDMADVKAAMDLLASYLGFEVFIARIGREHNLPANVRLEGWQWYVAAYRLASGKIKKSWNYFVGVVRAAAPEEYAEARAAMEPRSPSGPHAAHRTAAHREDAGERRERKNKEAAERMKEKDRANNSDR